MTKYCEDCLLTVDVECKQVALEGLPHITIIEWKCLL